MLSVHFIRNACSLNSHSYTDRDTCSRFRRSYRKESYLLLWRSPPLFSAGPHLGRIPSPAPLHALTRLCCVPRSNRCAGHYRAVSGAHFDGSRWKCTFWACRHDTPLHQWVQSHCPAPAPSCSRVPQDYDHITVLINLFILDSYLFKRVFQSASTPALLIQLI